ncbi:exodeoxyribonuclease VII large subunit [Caulobacter vibrioides]|uniref:exodeoxyribonuclease VII large subunit n=1 Tax=Caulobacter vibrioides TaxID=155892 RepID=UPI000BB4BC24|nr:exodeoxyribonuclease VII large subunit [Caulobacter vibrioides]ATC25250.1 exodeoxyribonuclease VII large subunit [Caulobacter vibrioides]AZH13347.1 exodeoxyribonuclease VII large subunit [Caulobacter vibrioides]PLR14020.1 exodeoxyribonuclease VII large subunit [Caulobacter vibrioides]
MSDLPPTDSNAPPYSVSELAFALKRTLEDRYGFVRLRGELSKVTHHSNGHVYLTIKDDKSAIDGVVWKGNVRGLGVRPEHGLEVIVTGKITTYPAGSRYQIVIDSMEAAGVGALLAQLERLKAKLAAEGLFAPERKRPLPSMPAVVGVITSPTGAVIRDILHRIRDRWPCQVLVWPCVVQGDAAAGQVSAAIRGFNAIQPGGPVPRPDVLIVARGGGSVEDLWAFNDEGLARTVAEGTIPLISAVGHETDTTLIDFVSDRRAPTPTAAAEMATPVLAELRALISDLDRRLNRCGARTIEERRTRLVSAARGLPRPNDLLALAQQRFDIASGRLDAALDRNTTVHAQSLLKVTARLTPEALGRQRAVKAERLADLSRRLDLAARRAPDRVAQHARLPALWDRLNAAGQRRLQRDADRLANLEKLRQSLNPERPLELGFALVRKGDGTLARSAADLVSGERVNLKFKSGDRDAVIDGEGGLAPAPTAPAPKPRPKPAAPPAGQGDLF